MKQPCFAGRIRRYAAVTGWELTIGSISKDRREGSGEIARQAFAALAAGASSAAILLFITRGLGPYYYFISALGGMLVAALTWGRSVLDLDPFSSGTGAASRGAPGRYLRTARIFIVLGLAALLGMILSLLVFPLEHSVHSTDAALSSLPISVFLFSLAVFFLCLAGDLLVMGKPREHRSRGALMRWLEEGFADFSWAVFSISVYLLLVLLALRIAFVARISRWDPLVEMSLAQVAGSALAWIITLRSKEAYDAGRAGVEDAEAAHDG